MSDLPFTITPGASDTDAVIRDRMLASVDPSFIRTEGDVIYDMLQPAALEIERFYSVLEQSFRQAFVITATGPWLDTLALQQLGMVRNDVAESDESFRARLLTAMLAPPGAGTLRDYKVWVGQTAGTGLIQVARQAGVLLHVYVLTEFHETPDSDMIEAVQATLDASAPVSAEVVAMAAAATPTPFTMSVYNGTPSELAKWASSIIDYVLTLEPGQDFNIYAALAAAGIPLSNYISHSLGADPDDVISFTEGNTVALTSAIITAV